jgi:hypothetical protein
MDIGKKKRQPAGEINEARRLPHEGEKGGFFCSISGSGNGMAESRLLV